MPPVSRFTPPSCYNGMSKQEGMTVKQAVRAIVTKGNKMLVMKRNKFGTEFYTLIGGGIDMGEDAEHALRRELMEESGITVGEVRLTFAEDAKAPYGVQYVYWCEYQDGEPHLDPSTVEAQLSAQGQNIYEPMWLPIAKLPDTLFRSGSLKDALIDAFAHGFPAEPKQLVWKSEHGQVN